MLGSDPSETRLSNAQSHYGNISYGYDALGNRNSKTDVANTGTLTDGYGAYVYASTANQLTAINKDTSSTNYSYDANGNPTSIANNTYIYNAQNRLSQVKNAANQTIASYAYNALGQRMLKTTGSNTTLFIYDQSGSLLSELHADGSARDYIYINGQRLAIAENNNTYYIHSNHLDTPQSITNQNQTIVWAADYDPFGKATVTVNAIENNLRFPGQYFDQETELNYNLQRYFDSKLGRYITSDRIGLTGGANTYLYANANPIVYFDPNGESAIIRLLVPPGLCSSGSHASLQNEVDRACKKKRKCTPGQDCAELSRNLQNNIECAKARERINSICFAGGNPGHRIASTAAWLAAGNCGKYLQQKNCGGQCFAQ